MSTRTWGFKNGTEEVIKTRNEQASALAPHLLEFVRGYAKSHNLPMTDVLFLTGRVTTVYHAEYRQKSREAAAAMAVELDADGNVKATPKVGKSAKTEADVLTAILAAVKDGNAKTEALAKRLEEVENSLK